MPERDPRPRVRVVDADPDLAALLAVWMAGRATLVTAHDGDAAIDLLLVDIPFPRQAAPRLRQLAEAHPGTPVLALSSTFFGGVASQGDAARSLGVAAVLPKPLARDALLAAVDELLPDRS